MKLVGQMSSFHVQILAGGNFSDEVSRLLMSEALVVDVARASKVITERALTLRANVVTPVV